MNLRYIVHASYYVNCCFMLFLPCLFYQGTIMAENDRMTLYSYEIGKYTRKGYSVVLCVYYLIGAFSGIFLTRKYISLVTGTMILPVKAELLIIEFIPVFLLLLYSTSTIGRFLIPVLFIVIGFCIGTSSVCLIESGVDTLNCSLIVGTPLVFGMCALLPLGDIAMKKAVFLSRMARNGPDAAEPVSSGFLLFLSFLLIALSTAAAYRFSLLI